MEAKTKNVLTASMAVVIFGGGVFVGSHSVDRERHLEPYALVQDRFTQVQKEECRRDENCQDLILFEDLPSRPDFGLVEQEVFEQDN